MTVVAERGSGGRGDELLGQLHHVRVVRECLVGLEHGELRVVPRVDTLVAKDATDLEDSLVPADDETLQVKLEGDAEVRVDIERVEVRDERSRRGSPGQFVEHERLDLHEVFRRQVLADRADRGVPDVEHAARLGVHDQVEIPLPHPDLGVADPARLVRQRPQRLRQQLSAGDPDRLLAGLRHHDGALDAHPVADIEVTEPREVLAIESVPLNHELDLPGLIV